MVTFEIVHSVVRPARVAVLLDSGDEDWQETVLRTIEWSCLHWGGAYFVLIPTDGKTIAPLFWSILDAYDPDGICAYRKTLIDWKIAKPDRYDKWLDDNVQIFSKANPGSDAAANRVAFAGQASRARLGNFDISPVLKQELTERLAPFHYKDQLVPGIAGADIEPHYPLTALGTVLPNCEHPENVTTLSPLGDPLLELIAGAIAGSFREGTLTKLGLQRSPAIENFDCLRALPGLVLDQRLSSDSSSALPFDFTICGLSYYRRGYVSPILSPIFIVAGSSLEDFCLFYDLSRMCGQTVWVPNEFLREVPSDGRAARPEQPRMSFLSSAMSRISTQTIQKGKYAKLVLMNGSGETDCLPKVVNLLSSLVYFEQEAFAETFTICSDVSEFVQSPRIVLERENFRTTVEPFVDGDSAGFFQTPRPRNFRYINPQDHRWITEVAIDKRKTPRLVGLGERTVGIKHYSRQEIRAGKDGVAYICPNNMYFGGELESVLVRPKLAVLDGRRVFNLLFEAEGYLVTCSDKGGFTQDSIAKMGSLEQLAETLRNSATKAVFEKFLDLSPNKAGVHDDGANVEGRRYLDFRAMEKLTGDKGKTAELIDDMTKRGVFSRGYIFKCQRCRNADWHDVADVTQSFQCQRCKQSQVYQKSHWRYPDEPQWYFKLDEVLYQALRGGCATTILALSALKNRAKDTFEFIPEFEIRTSPEEGKPLMEIDFACNIDGLLVLGEAKEGGRLGCNPEEEDKKLESYKLAATTIRASQVVFATSSQTWAAQTEAKARQAFEKTDVTPVFLCGSDLELHSV